MSMLKRRHCIKNPIRFLSRNHFKESEMKKIIYPCLLAIMMLAGCAQSHMAPTYSTDADELLEKKKASYSEKKIIRESELKLLVKNGDSTNARITKIADKYKGYLVLSGNQDIQIRVEAALMNEAIEDISKLGKVQYKFLRGRDVSDFYLDNEIRLENAERARKKYLELLDKAQTVSEGIMVEKELERLNGEIDGLKGKLKNMDHLSEYATIDVRLQEKKILGPLGLVSVAVYKIVKLLFVIA
jgi:hypothetical protein